MGATLVAGHETFRKCSLKEGPWVFLGTGLPFLNPRLGPVFALVVPAQKRGPILFSKSASFLGFETAKFFQMLVHLGAPDGPVVNRCAFNDTFQNMDSVYQPEKSPLRPGLLLFLTPRPSDKPFLFSLHLLEVFLFVLNICKFYILEDLPKPRSALQ